MRLLSENVGTIDLSASSLSVIACVLLSIKLGCGCSVITSSVVIWLLFIMCCFVGCCYLIFDAFLVISFRSFLLFFAITTIVSKTKMKMSPPFSNLVIAQ